MAAFQGPALLAFNDAAFSPGDFAAITRIGQDAKLSQPAATGRFGVGWNAVYHLTDAPSFVSGSSLVVFDPRECVWFFVFAPCVPEAATFLLWWALGMLRDAIPLSHTTPHNPITLEQQTPSTCPARRRRRPACA